MTISRYQGGACLPHLQRMSSEIVAKLAQPRVIIQEKVSGPVKRDPTQKLSKGGWLAYYMIVGTFYSLKQNESETLAKQASLVCRAGSLHIISPLVRTFTFVSLREDSPRTEQKTLQTLIQNTGDYFYEMSIFIFDLRLSR